MSAADNLQRALSLPAWTWLLIAAPLPFLCYAAVELDIAPLAAIVLVSVSVMVLWPQRHAGTAATLIIAFFLVAACHVIVGYIVADRTSRLIWIGTRAEQVYAQAFLLISAGLLAATIGYALASSFPKSRVQEFCRRLDFNDARVIAVARTFIVPGALLVAFVYARIGLIPLLADSPGRARYFNYQLSSDYLLDEWLVSRALDLLTFSLPLVIASAIWHKKWLDGVLATLGLTALLVPLRRANLMSVFFVLLLMHALKVGRPQLKHAGVVIALIAAYAISQFVFVNIVGFGDFDAESGITVAGSALPEVRDLGWTLDLLHGQSLYGTTFVQALVPIPSLLSDFSQTHSLRVVTSRLIGLDVDRQTGGLRLTMAGEAYLNFGYFGPVIVGLLFGVACAYVETAMRVLATRRAMWAHCLAAVLFVWLCFWVYLGGTQAAATVKIGGALLLLTLYLSRTRPDNAVAPVLPTREVRA
jgi:oligosaccharide repeat unit polymerase